MELSRQSILTNKTQFENAGFSLPQYNIDNAAENTRFDTEWMHFGAGNIFRAFVANCSQTLLNKGLTKGGIFAVETFDNQVITEAYDAFDNLTALVKTKANGEFDMSIVASVGVALTYSQNKRVIETAFISQGLQMLTFTVTEKGYALHNSDGVYLPFVKNDIEAGPDGECAHLASIVCSLLHKRYKAGSFPIALVSMDNCSHNGDILKNAVLTIAKEWSEKGFVKNKFIEYLTNENTVSFPLTMIDKITPRPSESIKEHLSKSGLEGMDIIVTDKNTYTAGFVNAEICEYLVIEDKFPNGRPKLEEAGVIFTDRDTVNKVETMKVTTCLNPLHTALAVSGVLLGYTSIWEEMKDGDLRKLVETIGYTEGLKVVTDPGILNPKEFIDEVLNERFPNANIPDTPQRIATDTSQKVGIRFGETIKKYMQDSSLSVDDLNGIPLAIALWCRYLVGIDDNGEVMELSSDPMLEELRELVASAKIGSSCSILPILKNPKVFDFDLCSTSLAEKIQGMFDFMIQEKGNVRKSIQKL